MTCVSMFSKAQGVPGAEPDVITDNSNWPRTNVEAKLHSAVHQAQRHEVTSPFILAIVHNQTCTNTKKYHPLIALQFAELILYFFV